MNIDPATRTCKEYPEIAQGTPEWAALRAGLPTSSRFDDIVTPSGERSKSRDGYLCQLLGERMLGFPDESPSTKMMDRGRGMEAEAVLAYEFQHELDTVKVGFITNAAGTIGASPDRLVGNVGLLEVKCPSLAVHVSYLRRTGNAYAKYKIQVQGQLLIAQRDWSDTLSYFPGLPDAEYRVDRDEEFIALKMTPKIEEFSAELESEWQKCIEKGWDRQIAEARKVQPLPGSRSIDELVAMANAAGHRTPEF